MRRSQRRNRERGSMNDRKETDMNNEQIIRKAYQTAEDRDIAGWVASFTADGTFTDESLGVTYRGPSELGKTVEAYARAFSDMLGGRTA
jgi:ketosteroid isomerase-like protein